MTETPGLLWTVLSFLIVIGPLIFVHELGHYFVGRWFGVKAETFSIGFGREIVGWTDKRETRWKIGWLPLGGYVKFAGDMSPAGQPSPEWLNLPPEERARTFQAKPVWQRFLIVAAGPVTNFLFAILIFAGFHIALGEPRTPPVVAGVKSASAAAEAGLRPGDRILAIDGDEISRFEDIAPRIVLRPRQPVELRIEREGRVGEMVAVPKEEIQRDRFGNEFKSAVLGIHPGRTKLEPVSVPTALGASVRQTWMVVSTTIEGLGQILTGRRSVQELGGPLKIAKYSGEQASLGWLYYLWFVAVISINLGFINLLPVPLLDGGHLLFYAIEGIRRRPIQPETQERAFRAGLAALLALMIFVTLNDLASFGLWSKLGGLIG